MITRLAHVSIVVRDQDEALKFYTEKLGLEKRSDDTSQPGFRWLTVAPRGQKEVEIVLFQPGDYLGAEGKQRFLDQIGTQAHYVFYTDDCREEVKALRERGVSIIGEPEDVAWGTQAVFEDLYGNQFVLVQPRLQWDSNWVPT